MIEVIVPKELIKGEYQRHVVENGNIPGVLSGAELVGRALLYGGHYAISREAVAARLSEYGIRSEIVLMRRYENAPISPRRWARVWTLNGRRVRLTVSE